MKIAKRCALFILMLASGCVVPLPKPFPISPELAVNASGIGENREVFLEVSDKRVFGGNGANYTVPIEGDFAAIVRDSLSQGLRSEGFTIVPTKAPGASQLRVDILALRHLFHAGLIIPYHQDGAIFVLKSACVAANEAQLEKQYSKSDWTCCFHDQTRTEKEQQVTKTVSFAINQMLNDDQLRQCLVEPKQVVGAASAHLLPQQSERSDARIGR